MGKKIKTSINTFLEEKENEDLIKEAKSMTREERWAEITKIVEENASKRTKTLDEICDEIEEWEKERYKNK